MSPPSPLVCTFLPRPSEDNPYTSLLADALAAESVRVDPAPKPTLRWALGSGVPDVVHIHWLEYLVQSRRGGPRARPWFSAGRGLRLLAILALLRARRVRIVWTVHNLAAHEPVAPAVERTVARCSMVLVHRAVVHSRHARERVVAELGHPGKVAVAAHGNYVGVYPPDPRPPGAIRRALGLPPDAFVLVCFGSLRRYKRIPEAIARFRAAGIPEAALLIVGSASDAIELDAIERAAGADPRVVVRPEFVPVAEVSGYLKAADALWINYDEVFSSGAMLLALSHGVSVLAPPGGAADELADGRAVLVDWDADLRAAVSDLRSVPREQREVAARRAADRYPWAGTARVVAAIYRGA